ncbi:hypothetical protein HS125_08710 [bacterium]|nr:hypothetical protein [bacterium]
MQHYVGTFWDVLDAPSGDMAVLFYRRLASDNPSARRSCQRGSGWPPTAERRT